MTAATFQHIPLSIHKKLSLEENPVSLVSLSDGGYLLNFRAKPAVIRLDAALTETAHHDLQAQTTNFVNCSLAASGDAKLIALSGETAVRITNEEGQLLWQHTHEPWYHFLGAGCFFSGNDPLLWFITPGERDVLHVMRTDDFSIIDSYELEAGQEYNYTFHPTPDKERILLAAAAGQEVAKLYLIQLQEQIIVLEALPQCDDGIPGNFSPDGKTLVVAPHYEDDLQLFSFPEMEKTAQVSQEAIFAVSDQYKTPEETDTLNYTVFFLNDATLMAFTRFGRLLLIDRATLVCFGELLPEDCEIRAYDFAGRTTTDPAEIVDYGGDIITVELNQQEQLVLTHSNGELRIYEMPAGIRINP